MGIIELFLLAAGLSMDAFAVSVCKGLALEEIKFRHMGTVGLWFGAFQALMPLAGYFLGIQFRDSITAVDHWVAFVLLALIGAGMIREARSDDEEKDKETSASLSFLSMFPLAVATSIDALAAGITFAFLRVNIVAAVALIGATTFLFSAAGVRIGSVFGTRFKSSAELAGGAALILLGAKILLQHLGFL